MLSRAHAAVGMAAVLAAACLAAPASAATDALPVAPLTILGKDGKKVILELRADGEIVDAHGDGLGKVTARAVSFDEGALPLWSVDAEGNVTCSLLVGSGRFDDDDALVFDSKGVRERMSVGDDGALLVARSGASQSPPLRVAGVTGRSRRAALLLALSVLVLQREHEREGPPPRPRRVTLTLDAMQVARGYVELTSELRLSSRWSLAMKAGGGAASLDATAATTTGVEVGIEPRLFVLGSFAEGLYLGLSTRYARTVHGPVGFETFHTPPGLSTGALVGFKSTSVPIITPDFSVGLLAPLVTPTSEVSHPPVALVVRLGFGFSF